MSLASTLLLTGIVGSTAYGLAGPDSDVDRLGMFAAPTAAFHGIDMPTDKHATIVHSDPDFTMHEARKMVMLLTSANPTVTELLWLPDHLYEVRTPFGEELVALRGSLASARRTRDAFFGYAVAQMKRLAETGQFQSKMRARSEKHGRHLLRLLDQGVAFYHTGVLTVPVFDPERYFEFGRRVVADPSLGQQEIAKAEEILNRVTSALPAEPDMAAANDWLRRLRAAEWAGQLR